MLSFFKEEHILHISRTSAKRPPSTEGKPGIHETLEKRSEIRSLTLWRMFSYFLSSFSQHGYRWENTSSRWFLGCHFWNLNYANENVFAVVFSLTNQEMDRGVLFFWIFLGKQMPQDSSPHSPLNKNRQLFSSKSIRLQCHIFKRQNVFSTSKDLEPQPQNHYFVTLIGMILGHKFWFF